MTHKNDLEPRSSFASTLWIAAIAAVGVGTAAAILLRHKGVAATKRHVDDLVEMCDDAAEALERRLSPVGASF